MGTYSRPGITRGEAALVDRSASTINKELQSLGVEFENQVANIELNKKAALTQQMEVYKQANEIDTKQGEGKLSSSMADALRKSADDLYYSTINSMGEDQTETLIKETNLLNSIENLGGNLGALDLDAAKLKEMIEANKSDFISINSDEKSRLLYRNVALYGGAGSEVNGIKPIGVKIENGNVILSQESKDGTFEFSLNQYSKARENGAPGHVQFVDEEALGKGYQGDWDSATKKYPLLSQKTTDNRGNKRTVQETKLYEQQSKEAYEDIKNDPQGIATLTSDDWQFFNANGFYQAEKNTNGEVTENWTGSKEQRIRLQKAKADYLQDTYSELDRTAQVDGKNVPGNITYNDPKKGGKGDKKNAIKLNHTSFVEELANIKETPTNLLNFKDKVEKENGIDIVRVRKLEDIKKYLLKATKGKDVDIKQGTNAAVKNGFGDDKNYDPNSLYQITGAGTSTDPTTYTPIDLESDFTDDVLNDMQAMEDQLNTELGIKVNPI